MNTHPTRERGERTRFSKLARRLFVGMTPLVVVVVDMIDLIWWSVDCRAEAGVPPCPPRDDLKHRSAAVFVALKAGVQVRAVGRDIVWNMLYPVLQADVQAIRPCVLCVVEPNQRALRGKPDILQAAKGPLIADQ